MRSKLLNKFFCAVFAVLVALSGLCMTAYDVQAQSVSMNPGTSPMGSSSDYWRDIRYGAQGETTLPNKDTGYLIRSKGEDWRNLRNKTVFTYGALGLAVMVGALAAFFLIRGQIKLDGEKSGRLVLRFSAIERYNHWAMAGSFILLGLTGLNMLYGRAVLLPLIGPEAFSSLTGAGKFIHNNIAWLFMVTLVLTTVFWVKDNLWDRYDLNWILKGGGMFSPGVHPPTAKFNFGEKTMFWLVVLGGAAVSYSGLTLLFPYLFGSLPIMQLMQLIHAGMGLVMVIAILGHIYIATIGMEGAIDGMKTGYVDETWAKEHHAAWAEDHGIQVEHKHSDEEHIAQGGIAE